MVILWWPLVRPMSILFRQLHISYVYLSHTRILIIILKSNNIMTIIIWVMLFLKVAGEYGLAYKHQFRKQILLLHMKKIALFKMTKLILSWSFFLCPLIRSLECEKIPEQQNSLWPKRISACINGIGLSPLFLTNIKIRLSSCECLNRGRLSTLHLSWHVVCPSALSN